MRDRKMSFGGRLLSSVLLFLIGAAIAIGWYYSSVPHGKGPHWVAIIASIVMILGVIAMLVSPRGR